MVEGRPDFNFRSDMSSKSVVEDKATGINWITTTWMVIFHLGAVAALFMFSWQALIAAFALWWVAGSPGVGMGFHRLLTNARCARLRVYMLRPGYLCRRLYIWLRRRNR